MGLFSQEDYVTVAERLTRFWEQHPDGRITTEVVESIAAKVIIKASVFANKDDAEPTATGHAYEVEGVGQVNKTSYVENCETSAVGRALAMMGYEIKRGIASREEMQKVERMQAQAAAAGQQGVTQQQYQQNAPTPMPPTPPQENYQFASPGDAANLASEGQVKAMYAISRERGLNLEMLTLSTYHLAPEALSRAQASAWIDQLKTMGGGPPQASAASTGDQATKPQLSALARIAENHGVSLTALIEQEFQDVSNPEQLTKKQASHLIDTYGTKRGS
jgi:hypothetical protein